MNFQRAALIIVDINHTHFDKELNYLPVPTEDIERILSLVPNEVMPEFRKRNLPIVFVKTMHRQFPSDGKAMSTMSPFWKNQMEKTVVSGVQQKRKTLAVEGSIAVEFMPQLEKKPEDLVVVKQRYSPFHNTDLEFVLRNLGVDTVFLVGANTNNCVLSTAFEAFNRDFKVVLIEDCCASMNGKECHELGVRQIKTSLGWVIKASNVADALDSTDYEV